MKSSRQNKILEIINQNDIETQGELVEELNRNGFQVTQATISRDIREMGLTKAVRNGRFVYIPEDSRSESEHPRQAKKFSRVFQEAFVDAETAGNLVIVRTMVGMAMAAAASLDSQKLPQVVGSLAGDDTIFIACQTPEDASAVRDQLLTMANA